MARKIRLNDGTILPVDRFAMLDDQLRIRVAPTDMDMLTAAQTFGDPEKTKVIEHYFEGTETDRHICTGYTELVALEMAYDARGVIVILNHVEPTETEGDDET